MMSRSLLLLTIGNLVALLVSPTIAAGHFVPTGTKNVVVQLFEWPWDR